MNPQGKLLICLFSDANFLAVNILENLLSKNCIVNVITKDTSNWKSRTRQLSTNNKFSIIDRKNLDSNNLYDYAIFFGGFVNSFNAYKEYADFSSLIDITQVKTLVIFPLEAFDRSRVEKFKVPDSLVVLFVGDLLGPRIDLESDLLASRLLSEILYERKMTLAVGDVLFPIFIADAVKVIVRWLFSFGPYGKVVFLLGSQTSGDTFWNYNQKYVGDLKLKYDLKIAARSIPKDFEREIVSSNLGFTLNETYGWLRNNWPKHPAPATETKEDKKKIVKIKKPSFRKFKTVILALFLLLVFPFVTVLISLLITFIAYKSFVAGNDGFSQNSFLLARTFAVVSEKTSKVFSYIPGFRLIYKETEFASVFTEQSDTIGTHAIPVVKDTTKLFESVFGDQVYDSTNQSRKIESEVEFLYNDVLLTKSLTDNASEQNIILAKKILSKIDFERFINLISECRILAANAPELLGQDKSKTYLVLFENNMELRPTGGFIGSFGLLTFDSGRLTDLTVNDVYSADGQLNGHVEPPAPIKNYLGEANWWFRDSNWDPDFPTSAKRAEWFLDKEISKQVDGVVAVDLFPIKEMLKNTGPIFLSDYNLDITSDNLYEKTQSEVDSSFFPGTHNKASFLTALSRSLLADFSSLKTNQKVDMLRTFYASLDERHIQVYLHENVSQDAFSALGWDGAVATPTCGTSCYADLVGVVEANVGDNKTNYFIQRNINLDVTLGASEINHKLTLSLKNPANPALGPSGRYKAYVRILVPDDASTVSVISYNAGVQETLSPELTEVRGHIEIGVLVDLLAGGDKNIEFSWTSGSEETTHLANYGLYIRKQAGTDSDPINIIIEGGGTQSNPDPRFALTREGSYSYNTTLARDLFLRLAW